MKAILRQVRISCKKAALVADLVRNKKVEDAIDILRFTTKKAAPLIKKVIEAAAANAENNFKQDKDNLYVKEVVVTEGSTLKRGVKISRGRSHPILKRCAHIAVTLESRGGSTKAAKVKTVQPEEAVTVEKTEPKAKKPKSKK